MKLYISIAYLKKGDVNLRLFMLKRKIIRIKEYFIYRNSIVKILRIRKNF